jgi:hypothetical protein
MQKKVAILKEMRKKLTPTDRATESVTLSEIFLANFRIQVPKLYTIHKGVENRIQKWKSRGIHVTTRHAFMRFQREKDEFST